MAEICRVTRSKEEAQSAYDRLSRRYDLLAGRREARLRGIGLEMLAAAGFDGRGARRQGDAVAQG